MPCLAGPRVANYTKTLMRNIAYDARRDERDLGKCGGEPALDMPREGLQECGVPHSFPAVNGGEADADEAEARCQRQHAAGANH